MQRNVFLILGLLWGGPLAFSKTVILEWSPLSNGEDFDFSIRGQTVKNKQFDQSIRSNKIELDISPGNYEWRVRGVNRSKQAGEWTAWNELSVLPETLPKLSPMQHEQHLDFETPNETIVFQFQVENQQWGPEFEFELEVFDESERLIFRKAQLKEGQKIPLELRVGEYTWKLSSELVSSSKRQFGPEAHGSLKVHKDANEKFLSNLKRSPWKLNFDYFILSHQYWLQSNAYNRDESMHGVEKGGAIELRHRLNGSWWSQLQGLYSQINLSDDSWNRWDFKTGMGKTIFYTPENSSQSLSFDLAVNFDLQKFVAHTPVQKILRQFGIGLEVDAGYHWNSSWDCLSRFHYTVPLLSQGLPSGLNSKASAINYRWSPEVGFQFENGTRLYLGARIEERAIHFNGGAASVPQVVNSKAYGAQSGLSGVF